MAAAEARTAWQRAANRYFVQEDAKRAPKLACCQSSNQSSKQLDPGNTNFVDGPGHPPIGFRPLDRTPSFSNLTPDSKWWLQMQPNYGHQRVLNPDQFNNQKDDLEMDSLVGEHNKTSEESIYSVEYKDMESVLDGKKCREMNMEDLGGIVDGKVDQDLVDLKNMTDYYEFLEMEMVGRLDSKRTSDFSSNSDSSWLGGEKMPWWRVTDGEELASFVAHKSLHHIENCDLPPPQKVHVRSGVYENAMSIDHDEMLISSRGWEVQSDSISCRSFGGSQRKHWSQVEEGVSHHENASTELLRTTSTTPSEGRQTVSDHSKAQLLEALCHSQTRAREAENAAKQAHTEKEHLLKLFFRQASQLFAYKQWFKMLQLETLVLETKDDDPSHLTTLFPDLPLWMPMKQRKLRKNGVKTVKGKRRRRGSRGNGNDIGKYAAAFALGFTLVGAGLILGWTVGWLLL